MQVESSGETKVREMNGEIATNREGAHRLGKHWEEGRAKEGDVAPAWRESRTLEKGNHRNHRKQENTQNTHIMNKRTGPWQKNCITYHTSVY